MRKGEVDPRKLTARLLHEFLMFKTLDTSGLSPHILYISDPLVLDESMTAVPARMESSYLRRNFAECASKRAHIRYMLIEQVGPSVSKYFHWIQSDASLFSSTEFTRRVLVIGKKIIRLLEPLHALGIVHGDVHSGNIAFRRRVDDFTEIDVDNDELVLLDFEFASFYPEGFGKKVESHDLTQERNLRLRPELLSPWQNLNFRPGPRDDVYRVMLMSANWISRQRFAKGYRSLLKTNLESHGDPPAKSIQYKQIERHLTNYVRANSPMFEYSFMLGSGAIIGDDQVLSIDHENAVRQKLENLHVHLLAYNHPDMAINYQHLDAELGQTLALFP
jgi:serine/threonine protein kinase